MNQWGGCYPTYVISQTDVTPFCHVYQHIEEIFESFLSRYTATQCFTLMTNKTFQAQMEETEELVIVHFVSPCFTVFKIILMHPNFILVLYPTVSCHRWLTEAFRMVSRVQYNI